MESLLCSRTSRSSGLDTTRTSTISSEEQINNLEMSAVTLNEPGDQNRTVEQDSYEEPMFVMSSSSSEECCKEDTMSIDHEEQTSNKNDPVKIDSGFHDGYSFLDEGMSSFTSEMSPRRLMATSDGNSSELHNLQENSGTCSSDFVFVTNDLLSDCSHKTYLEMACDETAQSKMKEHKVNKPLELIILGKTSTAIIKTTEQHLNDERDSFSPEETDDTSFIRHEESAATNESAMLTPDTIDDILDDNLQYENKKYDQPRSSTKEEKQRQNEEIVNLESSSISSETGSWESVFPMKNLHETRDICIAFLQNEQKYCSQFGSDNQEKYHVAAKKNSVKYQDSDYEALAANSTNSEHRRGDITPTKEHLTPVKKNACFIDASTLYDDVEIPQYIPLLIQENRHHLEPGVSGIKVTAFKTNENSTEPSFQTTAEFRKELCVTESLNPVQNPKRIKRMDSNSSASEDTSVKDDKSFKKCKPTNAEFFGDNELNFQSNFEMCSIHRTDSDDVEEVDADDTFNGTELATEVKNVDGKVESKSTGPDFELRRSGLVRRRTFELDIDEDRTQYLRQEQERRQGHLIFSNSIPQYSGHVIEPEIQSSKMAEGCDSIGKISNISQLQDINSEVDYTFATKSFTTDGILVPDTPNNSLIQIDLDILNLTTPVTSDNELKSDEPLPPTVTCIDAVPDVEIQEKIHHDVNLKSLDIITNVRSTFDQVDSPKRQSRYAESAPVLSGGVCVKDFTPPKVYDSPLSRRKLESTPIVSGGSVLTIDSAESIIIKKEKPKSVTPCWVVDMSDCKTNKSPETRRKSEGSAKFETDLQVLSVEIEASDSPSAKSKGFFVEFGESKRKNSPINKSAISKSDNSSDSSKSSCSSKKSTEFFIDFSKKNEDVPKTKHPRTPLSVPGDKKNMFSMFIDFGETVKKEIPNRLATSLYNQKSTDKSNTVKTNNVKKQTDYTVMSKSLAAVGTQELRERENKSQSTYMFIDIKDDNNTQLEEPKDATAQSEPNGTIDNSEIKSKGYFVFIESTSPVVRRRTPSDSVSKSSTKRHSWNTVPTPMDSEQIDVKVSNHKRAFSLSVDRNQMNGGNLLSTHKTQGSTVSLDSNNSALSDYSISKSELSSGSSNSNYDPKQMTASCYGRLPDAKKHRCDVKTNETFDKSSPVSQSESLLTKDSSPTSTETDDVTYQNELNENQEKSPTKPLSDRPVTMETIVETKEIAFNTNVTLGDKEKNAVVHTMETLQATIERQKQLLATVAESECLVIETTKSGCENFVRLSDLDKPIQKFDLLNEKIMSNSAGSNRISKLFPDALENRKYMSRSIGNNCTNLVTSVENSRSLSRLFPHLSKGFSSSLPSGVGTASITRSPLDTEDLVSDLSGVSSLSSSVGRSVLDSTEDSLSKQPRRLGEDLLRMFLEEIAPDVTVEVGGRRMKAHKCILRSRCQYFAAILAGGWVQSSGNVISMQGFTYAAVHFALCHIYSGATTPPEGISLQELASLADLLGLEGLKEVTAHALKATYCHMFHKPCSECISGVCQVLPLSLTYGLDELYRRAMRWVCRHFLKIWPTRAFAGLSRDIMDRSRHHIIAHLSVENVLCTILDCEQLISTLPSARWSSIIESLTLSLLESAQSYVADHFASLLASNSFLSLGRDMSWNISRLDKTLADAANNLSPDQACRSYQRTMRLSSLVHRTHQPCLVKGDHKGHEDIDWNQEFICLVDMLLSLVEACLVRQGSRAIRVPAWGRLEPHLRRRIQDMACLGCPIERKSRSARSTNSISRSQDLRQIRQAMHAQTKRASSHDSQPKTTNKEESHIINHRSTSTERHSYPGHDRHDKKVRSDKSDTSVNVDKTNISVEIPVTDSKRTLLPGIEKSSSHKNILVRIDVPANTNKDCITNTVKINKSNERLTHQRSQSVSVDIKQTQDIHKTETIISKGIISNTSKPKPLQARLADAKPRYLEPRKRDIKVETIPNKKCKGISSSESSRAPSPAMRIKHNKVTNKSVSNNMSLDSLASPANGRGKTVAPLKSKNEMEMSTDSLAESLSISTRTNYNENTISDNILNLNIVEENLQTVKTKPLIRDSRNTNAKINKNNLSKSAPNMNKENLSMTKNNTRLKNIPKSGTSSCNARSPSSVIRNKTISNITVSPQSRKSSSVSSNTNSPSLRRSLLTSKPESLLLKNKTSNVKTGSTTSVTKNKSSPTLQQKYLEVKIPNVTSQNKRVTRLQGSLSLTSPTKSSAAKIISNKQKNSSMESKKPLSAGTQSKSIKNEIDGELLEARIMACVERQGTFLKDEPTIPSKSIVQE